jgi:acetoacetyl-CoA synthetase
MSAPLWSPSPDRVDHSNLTRFMAQVKPGASFGEVYRWSNQQPEEFWPAVWDFCGLRGTKGNVVLRNGDVMAPPSSIASDSAERRTNGPPSAGPPWPAEGGPMVRHSAGPSWFPEARLNFASNLLRFDDDREALVFWNETGRQRALTYAQLQREVARWRSALVRSGVVKGDRVVGLMPNMPETVIAMLAATSLGAIWSGCSPDFGDRAVLDRFGQIQPKVMVATDGYRYGGKLIDLRERVKKIAAHLPELSAVVLVSYLANNLPQIHADYKDSLIVEAEAWLAAGESAQSAKSADTFPFSHPTYILYSSGTTGLPKAIVHGAGGTLLQLQKELVLHTDLRREDRFFYYTTCGWMMWHYLISGLAVGATLILYDGAPLQPKADQLWAMAEQERVTVFGTSAKYLSVCEKEGVEPRRHDLSALRMILSTGSPLSVASYDYVYRQIKPDVHLASISGGTDIISCFALGNPNAPVYRGELQTRGLGMAVDIYDADGRSIRGTPGELVCTRPFPSMPVSFWNDPDGSRYHSAYFAHFPNVWRHGDWAELTEHDGLIIFGRSDATLNPGGVRIGTAEIYRQVERLPEVVESLVVAQDWDDDVRIVLFVRLRDGIVLDDPLRERLRKEIRANASPHHVPRKIVQVSDLPRTINGKLSELAVRAIIHGRVAGNSDALANPEALEQFRGIPELAT